MITCDVPVRVAEKLIGADYRTFSHDATGTTLARTLEFLMPAEIPDAVTIVGPTTRFAHRAPRGGAPDHRSGRRADGAASTTNDPATLRALYDVGDVLGGAAADNKQAATAFLGQYYSADAEAAFFAKYLPEAADTPLAFVGDAITGATPGIESMLDIEYMPAMGALNPTEFWGFSGASPVNSADEPFLTWLYTVGNTSDADVPLVFSTSYGEDESTEVPTDYSERVNLEFVKVSSGTPNPHRGVVVRTHEREEDPLFLTAKRTTHKRSDTRG